MNRDKNKEDFGDRKDFRRKNIKNKSLDKKNFFDEENNIPKSRKELKKKIEDMKADEIWEDWEDYYNK